MVIQVRSMEIMLLVMSAEQLASDALLCNSTAGLAY
jgi:hypothetical protein